MDVRPEMAGAERPVENGKPVAGGEHSLAGGWNPRPDLPTLDLYQMQHTFSGHTDSITTVKIDQSGGRMASASADASARIWDVEGGRVEATLRCSQEVGSPRCQHSSTPAGAGPPQKLTLPLPWRRHDAVDAAAGLLRRGVEPGWAPAGHRLRRRRGAAVGPRLWQVCAATARPHALPHLRLLLRLRDAPGQRQLRRDGAPRVLPPPGFFLRGRPQAAARLLSGAHV
jgi:hypothetical protein